MGLETALVIGLAAAGAGTATYSSVQQNQAAKAQKTAAGHAASVKSAQVQDQAAIERLKVIRRSALIRGRLKNSSAEAGLGDFGSLDLLEQQNESDTGLNLDILKKNTDNTEGLIGSQLGAELARISSSYRNAVLSSFEGGLGGAQQGLQIGAGVRQLQS